VATVLIKILEIGLNVCFDDFYAKLEYGLHAVKNSVTPPKYGKPF
jgi:hypothetical protein